jgi:hypothetical protein
VYWKSFLTWPQKSCCITSDMFYWLIRQKPTQIQEKDQRSFLIMGLLKDCCFSSSWCEQCQRSEAITKCTCESNCYISFLCYTISHHKI